mgnify:CR=1 FL=1
MTKQKRGKQKTNKNTKPKHNMSEENNDPLSADVGDKELTKMPLLPADRLLRFEIRKPVTAPTKKDPAKNMLTIPCHLVEDTRGTDGAVVHKGFPIFMRYTVTPTEERSAKQIAADIGRLCQALGIKGVKVIDIINDPKTHLDGKIFDAKTRIVPEKDGYPESNTLNPVPLA